jgi:hypothetical protein
MARLDAVVGYAQARGMKVLLDLHNFNQYYLSGSCCYVGGTDGNVTVAHLQNVWSQLAAHYANNSAVYGYDIMNEPIATMTVWQPEAQAVVNTIRQVDTTHFIFVEGVNWSSAGNWATDFGGGASSSLNITDSADKLVYSAHTYWNSYGDGTYGANEQGTATTGVTQAQPFLSWIQSHGYNGHFGEFGVPNNSNNYLASWETALDGFLAYCKVNNISATYFAGGPWWGTYPLSCEPTNNYTTDALQMSVLQNYNQTQSTGSTQSALITFSGYETAAGRTLGDGWFGTPSTNYQPLLNTYAAQSGSNAYGAYNTVADGANVGVTCDFSGACVSASGHTGDTPDYALQAWPGTWHLATFSAPVYLSSFSIYWDWNAGNNAGTQLQLFTNATDTTPVATLSASYTGGWQQITSLSAYPITKMVLVIPNGNAFLDGLTVTKASPKSALITFSGYETAAGRTLGDGWFGTPSTNYQPLLNTYAAQSGSNAYGAYNTVADGANVGVTCDFSGACVSASGHTGDTPDYALQAWPGTWHLATFSAPVYLSSFSIYWDWNAGNNAGTQLQLFTNATDTTPVATLSASYTGGWQQITSLSAYPITKMVLVIPNGNAFIDGLTVAVP